LGLEDFSLKDKVILFTGGAGHIVSALVEDFAKQGAVCISADIRPEKLKSQEERLLSLGCKIETVELNVSEEHEWRVLLSNLVNRHSHIDGLINGAGINAPSSFFDIDLNTFKSIFDVNVIGTLIGCMIIGRHMVEYGIGSIVNISSTSSDPPLSKAFAYSASKASVTNLTKNVAREFGQTGVRVNALRPGFFPTDWNKKNFLSPKRTKSILNHTPMHRFGEPQELTGATQWLLSDASRFVTGTEVIVDGGFSCQTI
jgi:NAD(P)-dependent dehydrogenase (short-subunit alcohol dehydrogenase family)